MPGEALTADLINELEQYRRILNNIPAEIGVLDTDGRYLFNTPSGIRDPEVREWMLGKTNHEWVRKRGHPIEIAERRQAAVDHCVSEKESVTFEEIWTDRQGRRLYYVRTFSPVEDEAGTVTHVLGYGQQITQLKKAEEELRTALAEVEALRDRLHHENQYLYFSVSDLAAVRNRIEEAGGHNLTEIESMPWGERMFYALDPLGSRLSFVDAATLFTGSD